MYRNDFSIVVDKNGGVWLAQGNPALNKTPEHVAMESDLFYSQLRHRAVWREGVKVVIGYPKDAPSNAVFVTTQRSCTGSPVLLGEV